MKWWWLVLLGGCSKLFGLQELPPVDAAADAPPPGQWASVVTGSRHACGLDHDGNLACWGDAVAGGGTITPARVGSGTWTEISASARHTCGVQDGHAWCWGSNQYTQLTGAPGADRPVPQMVPLPAGTPAVDHVSAGTFHSCALAGGQLWCWGNAQQIGGTSTTPVQIGAGLPFTAVSAGFDHSCALTADGGVFCWGEDTWGQVTGNGCNGAACTMITPTQVPLAMPAIAVSAGTQSTCALLGTGGQGQIWCWGLSSVIVVGPSTSTPPVQATNGSDWTGVVAGNHGACGLRAGQAWCWGAVHAGGLGDGVWSETVMPTATLHGIPADAIALSRSTDLDESACSLLNGNVSCWGENRGGQLAIPGTLHVSPVVVGAPEGSWKHVVISDHHTCAVNDAGKLWCWGQDAVGEVTGAACAAEPCDKPTPTTPPVATSINEVIAGYDFTCAQTDLATTCWGGNASGQLGTAADVHTNQLVVSGGGTLTGGEYGACLVTPTGEACWGRGVTTPTAPAGVAVLAEVRFGISAACGVTPAGARGCWGYPYWGQLGDGINDGNAPPKAYAQGAEAATYHHVAMQFGHVCATADTGTTGAVNCWGTNYNGETGITNPGGYTLTPTPMSLDGGGLLAGCTAIATGAVASCAVCNARPMCWGGSFNGALGIGLESARPYGATAVAVPGGKAWTDIAAGNQLGCAVSSDGTLACWGLDIHGEIGDGSHGSSVPVMLPPPP